MPTPPACAGIKVAYPRWLGLDLGTRTGWAVSEGDRIIASGVRDFSIKPHEHIGQRGIRFYNFLLTLGQPDAIFYEKVQFVGNMKSSDGGELYKGLLMVLNMFAAGFNVETIGIFPSTLKLKFTGSGRAEKIDMCEQARWHGWKGGVPGSTLLNDEADALALLITQAWERHMVRLKFA